MAPTFWRTSHSATHTPVAGSTVEYEVLVCQARAHHGSLGVIVTTSVLPAMDMWVNIVHKDT
jgi:hypothetical protein